MELVIIALSGFVIGAIGMIGFLVIQGNRGKLAKWWKVK